MLDLRTEVLLRDREPLPLGRRAVALLRLLVERAGELVTKNELMTAGWGTMAVEESNLAVQIAALRRLLAAESAGREWIETLPRRGYRFTGPVSWDEAAAPFAAAAPPSPSEPARADEGRPSLAVLPFRTPEPAPVPQHVGDGLAEELVASLSSLAELTVISFGTTSRLRGAELEMPRIGRDLGVRYVASGSIRQFGTRSRIIAELADARTSAVLTSRTYDTDRAALFDAQDRIVAQIVQTIAPRVRNEELRRIRLKRPESLLAYDLVLQAREQIYQLDRDSFDRSEALLARAIAIEPGYAAAHSLSAEFHSLRLGQGWSKDQDGDLAAVERFASAAIERDPTDARALAFLAHNKALLRREYDAALALFARALDAAPGSAGAWMWSSVTFAFIGDGRTAVERAELALRLSPRDWFGFQYCAILGLAHYTAGSYAEAVRWGLASIAENPRYLSSLRYTAASMVAVGDLARARSLAREVIAIEPGFRVGRLVETHPYRDVARREQLGRHLREAGLPD